MTATIPVRSEAATTSVSDVAAVTSTSPAVATARGVKQLVRILQVGVLWDALVPVAMIPYLLRAPVASGHPHIEGALTIPACWLVLLAVFGVYDTNQATRGTDRLRRLAVAGLCFAAVLPAALAASGNVVAPVQVLTTAVLATGGAALHRLFTHSMSRRARARAATTVRVVVSGHRRAVDRVLGELASDPRSTFEVVHVCGAAQSGQDLPSMAKHLGAEAVVVVPCQHHDPVSLRRLGWQLEKTGVRLLVATGLHDVSRFRTTMEYAGALPFVQVRPAGIDSRRMWLKSAADRLIGFVVLLLLAPALLAVALVIVAESRGSALFRQTRIGKDGVPFTIFKFRTMSTGAEHEHARLSAAAGDDSVLFKLRVDPRVTRVGRFLRLYSVDELPQLINVVRGEMSLVGPRPALPTEVERYDSDTRRRLAVRPGLTGLWQVSGRSDLSWSDSVRIDLRYVDNWSLAGDLRIVGRTFGAVLTHRGAY